LLSQLLPEADQEPLLGDLEETYHARTRSSRGSLAARLWFWGETIRALLAAPTRRRHSSGYAGVRRAPISDIALDIRYALRQLVRSPVFSSISIVLLAVGIGVNAALFSVIDTRLGRPIPGVPDPDGLVSLSVRSDGARARPLYWQEFLELSDRQDVFQDIATAVTWGSRTTVDMGGDVFPTNAVFVSGAYFSVLRPAMAAGSPLPAADDRAARGEPLVVVSHAFWRSRLGGDSSAIGRTIRVNRVPVTIIGVVPGGLDTPSGVPNNLDLWLPYSIADLVHPPTVPPRGGGARTVPAAAAAVVVAGPAVTDLIARLRPGITEEQAAAAVSGILRGIGGAYRPESPLSGAVIERMADLGGEFASGSAIVGNLTILILLAACANVSILLLGRAVVRHREIAVRLALGARRSRVVRLLIVESVLLALVASSGGLLIAHWICGFFNAGFPLMGMDYAVSWRSTAATLAFAAATGILFGLTPALHATRADVAGALKTGGGATDRQRSPVQRAFVVAEVAISMALVCAAWLLVKAFGGPGGSGQTFELSNRVLIADVHFSRTSTGVPYTPERADALLSEARRRIGGRVGVEGASFSDAHPLGAGRPRFGFVGTPSGAATGAPGSRGVAGAAVAIADPDYFGVAGIPIRDGRDFARTDSAGATRVAIVDRLVAASLWPDRGAVGNVLMIGQLQSAARGVASDTTFLAYSVVGVVDAPRSYGATMTPYGRPIGSVFLPRLQLSATEGIRPSRDVTLVVRTSGPASDYAPGITGEFRALDADLALNGIGTTRGRYAERNRETLAMRNGAALAGLITLFMACVGVYAVIAFGVAQRRREIGIRMALGARRSQVVMLFFRDGIRLALLGFVIGVPVSLIAMRIALGRESGDILTAGSILAVVATLLTVAGLASWLPARRAAGIDPMEAARSE
jgi:predicted permease